MGSLKSYYIHFQNKYSDIYIYIYINIDILDLQISPAVFWLTVDQVQENHVQFPLSKI